MRRFRYLVLMGSIVGLLLFNQCNKKTYTLDPPPSKVEGLNGSWELYSVMQVDEISLAKAERNLTSFYISDTSTSVLEVSFNSSDHSFGVTLGAMGRNYLPSSGTWAFDNDDYPQYIYITDDEGNETTLKLQGPTRPQDQQLKFSFQRSCVIAGEEKEYVGYRYEFNRK